VSSCWLGRGSAWQGGFGGFLAATTMNNWFDTIMSGDAGGASLSPEALLLSLLVAFCLGHVIGWTYMTTHVGLSYSQMFVASLVVVPTLVALTMMLMSGDIVIAFGLLAVFAIVRFRNVLKDTRDTTFIMWAILAGMAAGTMRYSLAIISSGTVAMMFLYLWMTSFGGRHRYDVVVSMQTDASAMTSLGPVLRRHSLKVQVAAQRDLPEQMMDLSYRLLLRDPKRSQELLRELQSTEGVSQVSLYHRADEAEV
jgi:uncharacterized membrane protein YhiD involved in acid resistance